MLAKLMPLSLQRGNPDSGIQTLHAEIVAEIHRTNFSIGEYLFGCAFSQDAAGVDDVGVLANIQQGEPGQSQQLLLPTFTAEARSKKFRVYPETMHISIQQLLRQLLRELPGRFLMMMPYL